MKHLYPLTAGGWRIRQEDAWGSGAYGAPRGDRKHRGVDIVVEPGDTVLSPLSGIIVREAAPYDDDPGYSGILLRGTGPWEGCEIKLFYLEAPHAGEVRAGEALGVAQDLSARYPGIVNHVHLEVWRNGEIVDPTEFLGAVS